MTAGPVWQYNEMRPVGLDYSDGRQVRTYEGRRSRFKDYAAYAEPILEMLQPQQGQTLIDMGAGTGAFAIQAARRYEKVFAVDVSEAMLDYAREKARAAGVWNIEFHHAGFLTYEHAAGPVDAIVSMSALHHLPDFWKLIALRRLASMSKAGGRFYLSDMVYSFDATDYREIFDVTVRRAAERSGDEFAEQQWARGFGEEFMTQDWIMEGLLARAGFTIEQADYPGDLSAVYLCRMVSMQSRSASCRNEKADV